MNVHAVEKKTILIKTEEFVKYETVFDLFKILYNIYKMLNAQKHLDYCYCNQRKSQCWLCKLGEYVKYNDFKNELLRYRKNEYRMLNIADKFWFYIRKIKKDMKELHDDDKLALDFFNQQFDCGTTCFDDIIKNDIIEFNEKYMK